MAKTKLDNRFIDALSPSDIGVDGNFIASALDTQLGSNQWRTQKTDEQIQDVVGALLTSGVQTNITVTYNDVAGTMDFVASGSGGGLTQEQTEDIINNLIQTGTGINTVYNDIAGTLTISLTGIEFTQTLKDKIDGIEDNATQNDTNTNLRDRSTHTGTQTADTISDFQAEVSDNPDVVTNTLKRTYPLADETKLSSIEANAKDDQTPSEIRDALTTLTGAQRLDASAIQNIPSGTTNLSWTSNATSGAVQSDTGADAIIPTATTGISGLAGLISRDDKEKLDSIEQNASADQTGGEIETLLDIELANIRWKEQEIPAGGTTGQVLKKISNTDYDYSWQADATGGGGAGATQLAELSDVNTSTPINKNVLIADGTDFESRQLIADDISDFDIEVANNPSVTTNTAKRTYPLVDETKVGNITITSPKNLDNIEANATADQTGPEITTLLDTSLSNTRWKAVEVPAGGTTGQVLKKINGTDYNYSWATESAGATQLSELSDVNTSTVTNKNVLIADGSLFQSRAFLISDISGATPTITQLNYLQGVTSSIQTQLDSKGTGNVTKVGTPIANYLPLWTGDGTIKAQTDLLWIDDTQYAILRGQNGKGVLIGNSANSGLQSTLRIGRLNNTEGTTLIGGDGTASSSINLSNTGISAQLTISQINTVGGASLITKQYADATYATTGGGITTDNQNKINNSILPPKTISKNADFTLVLNDARMTTSGNTDLGRTYVSEVNDSGTTICTVPDVGTTDEIWRFRTATASDQMDIIPDTGVTLDWDGKTTENAARITGIKGGLIYMRKSATNNFFLDGDITGFTYSPPSTGLPTSAYPSANAANTDTNEVDGIQHFDNGGAWVVATSVATTPYDGNYFIRLNNDGSSTIFDTCRHQFPLASGTYNVSMWLRSSTGITPTSFTVREYGIDDGTVINVNYPVGLSNTWTEVTFTKTIGAGQTGMDIRMGGNDGEILDIDGIVINLV